MIVSKDPFSFISTLPPEKKDVYNIIRHAVVNLYLQPGLIVSIQDICEKFGMGRSPVRDALLRLEQDGLVNMLPQRGVRIALINPVRIEEERFLRFSVEKQVMARFMECYTTDDIAKLEEMIAEQKRVVTKEKIDPRKFLQLDDTFHQFFYKAIKMEFCLKIVSGVTGDYQRIRLLSVITGEEDPNIIQQHEEMVAAIAANNAKKVEEIFYVHLGKIDDEISMLQKQYEHLFIKSEEKEKENPLEGSDFLSKLV